MPADMEQAITEIGNLRRILRHERNMLAKVVEGREKYRRELSAVSSRLAGLESQLKDKEAEIEDLNHQLDEAEYSYWEEH